MFVYRYSVFVLGTSTTGKLSPGAGTHHASTGSPTPEREGGNSLLSCYFFNYRGRGRDKERKTVSDFTSVLDPDGSGFFFVNTDPNFKNKNLDPYVFCF